MNLLNVEILTALAGLAGGIGLSGIVSWLLGRYDKRHPVINIDDLIKQLEQLTSSVDITTLAEKLDALNKAVTELAYLRIRERHENAMRHGWLHPNEKHVLERLYSAYHSIGGNGTGTQMIDDIRRLPSVPPNGDTTSHMCQEQTEPPEHH